MIRFFFLVPLLMCAIWYWYLNDRGYSLKQGLRGFSYIFAFNLVIIAFFSLMIYLTHN